MQGLFIDGRRPKSKKEVRELVKAGGADRVRIEATSWHGGEYDGPLTDAPAGTIYWVGPNPHSDRRHYGTITVAPDGKVTVK